MADFSSVGISEEELREQIHKELAKYLSALNLACLYEDVEEDLKRIALKGKASQVSIYCVVGNISQYYKHTKEVSLSRERVSILYSLYMKFFPGFELAILQDSDNENADSAGLEDLLVQCRNADDKSYDRLLRRFSANFSLSLERYYGSERVGS